MVFPGQATIIRARICDPDPRLVVLTKEPGQRLGVQLGRSLVGGLTVVESVPPPSAAFGLVSPSDILLEVNGEAVLSPEHGAALLKEAEQVHLRLRPAGRCGLAAVLTTGVCLLALAAGATKHAVVLDYELDVALPPPSPLRVRARTRRHSKQPQPVGQPPWIQAAARSKHRTRLRQQEAPANNSLASPLAVGGYKPVRWKGVCASILDIQLIHAVPTLADCLDRCDAMRRRNRYAPLGTPQHVLKIRERCMAAEYNARNQSCVLKRQCLDRRSVVMGTCLPIHRWCMYMRGSTKSPRMRLGNYTRIGASGQCSSPVYDIAVASNLSLRSCFQRCDELRERHHHARRYILQSRTCETVRYSEERAECILKRACNERLGLTVGLCSPASRWCTYTHGPTTRFSASRAERNRSNELRASALLAAQQQLAEENQSWTGVSLCTAPAPLITSRGQLVGPTWKRSWRYYSVFECGNARLPHRVCLTFKTMGKAARVSRLVSSDGSSFGPPEDVLRLPDEWQEQMFVHNMAIIRLGEDEYAMVGGKQGFVSRSGCRDHVQCRANGSEGAFHRAHGRCAFVSSRDAAGTHWRAVGRDCHAQGFRVRGNASRTPLECRYASRQECLVPDDRGQPAHRGSMVPAVGIRLARGRGLPWDATRWTLPGRPVITGTSPSGCVDRRPPYTGYPRVTACEFDGRLSVVHHRGAYHMYARVGAFLTRTLAC